MEIVKSCMFKIILFSLLIPLGMLLFVYAEVDDSPGGQLIGVLVVVGGIYGIVKSRR